MKAPTLPADESSRLTELRELNILNTPDEERFDRLTRLARRMFGVPLALVSLVEEDHLWNKSIAGNGSRTTPRNISFCGHALLQEDVMVVENALADPRFHDNPLTLNSDTPVIFYAGCPLRTPGGVKVGTLCIVDHQPRAFDDEDKHTLRDLAAMAESELVAFQNATSDELTQITNRRGFMALGQMTLNEYQKQQRRASLTFLDLDRFKVINDTLGHREGDRALMDFADTMKMTFCQADLFARLGGDEFVVLFDGLSKADAEAALTRFRAQLQQQTRTLERRYALHFSSGVVEFDPAHPQSLQQLLADSDAQMYRAKSSKKPR